MEVRAESSYATEDLSGIDCTVIENPEHRAYVNAMLKFHLSNGKDARVRNAIEAGKSAVFFFDGASDHAWNGEYADYRKYRFSAVCVVVKAVDGLPQIVFMNDCCSTIPDNPRKPELNEGTPVPTVVDGIYPIVNCNHHDAYAALHLKCYQQGEALRCTQNGSYLDRSYGINIHSRGMNSISATSQNSEGCLLVGKSAASSDVYNRFMKAVAGIENAVSSRFSTVAQDMGVAVVDHMLYQEQIKAIYGSDNDHTAEQIADLITAFTKKLGVTVEADHEHRFSDPMTEEAHPHRTFRICSCGATEYLDEGSFRAGCEICEQLENDVRFASVLPFVCRLYGEEPVGSYSSARMDVPAGTLSPNEEYTVTAVYTTGACRVSGSGGVRFVPLSDVIFGEVGERIPSMTAKTEITTYRKADGAEYGYVGEGDVFYVLNTSGTRTQVLYPISGGYKLGWVEDAVLPYRWYTVRFDANGGENAPAMQKKREGKAVALSGQIPEKEGFTFVSWNTRADGSGMKYLPGETFYENSNLRLYAIWEEVPEETEPESPKRRSALPWVIGGAAAGAVALLAAGAILFRKKKH